MEKVLNVEATLERIDHDETRLRELYGIALQEFPNWRKRMHERIEAEETEAIQKIAHSYKGSSATLGAEKLHGLFLDIEKAARCSDIDEVKHLYHEYFEKAITELEAAIQEYRGSGE